MNLVYNQDRTTSQKPRPLSAHKSWICTRLHSMHCYHTYSIVTSVGFQNSCCEWLGFVFDQNLFQCHNFKEIFCSYRKFIISLGDLNNNDNSGFPFSGVYKQILELDVTIFSCILLKEIQYCINIPWELYYYFRKQKILVPNVGKLSEKKAIWCSRVESKPHLLNLNDSISFGMEMFVLPF